MSKSQRKFTKVMIMAVSILGLFSTTMLLNDPPSASDMDLSPLIFEVNSAKLNQISQRGIASLDVNREPDSSNVVELKCDTESQNFDTAELRLRIKGDNCLGEQTASTLIKNISNGFIATVFHKPDYSFTTDYINLSEGKNEIDVAFETATGVSKKMITINRTPSSKH